LKKLGRLAEIKGQSLFYNDLEIKLLIDTKDAKADYKKAAPWLKIIKQLCRWHQLLLVQTPRSSARLTYSF
jgi:hypothetical protein